MNRLSVLPMARQAGVEEGDVPDGQAIAVADNYGAVFGHADGKFHIRDAHIGYAAAATLNVHVRRRAAEAQQLGSAHVRDLVARHVRRRFRRWAEPGPTLTQEEVLGNSADASCVVLLGEPDSGLRSAAVAVLAALAGPDRLHNIPIDDAEEADDDPIADALRYVGSAAGYLLRLPEAAADPHLAERCEGHGKRLRQHGSWLVITANPRTWRAVGGAAGAAVFVVDPPDAIDLLRQACGSDIADRLMGDEAMRKLLNDVHGASDGARLARIAAEVTGSEGNTPDQWVADIEGAVHDWGHHLDDAFQGKVREAPQRCFLIAAAMLAGHHAPSISEAAVDLRRSLQTNGQASAAVDICGDSVSALAKAVGATLDEQRRLTWRKPRYDEAVLHYLYTEYPPRLWAAVWRWATALPRDDSDRGAAIAGRVSEQALRVAERYGDLEPLWQLVSWLERPALRSHLVNALTVAAFSDHLGRRVRNRLYDWATKRTPNAQHHLVALVCRGEFAVAFPKVSLTRLGHVADVDDDRLHVEVAESVQGMWMQPAIRPQVLRALVAWVGADSPRRRPALAILIRLLADDPTTLASAQPTVRRALADVLATRYAEAAPGRQQLLHALLDAAAAVPEAQPVVTEVMTDAVIRPGPVITRIAHICADLIGWCPASADDPERRHVRDLIHQTLHQANPLVTGVRQ